MTSTSTCIASVTCAFHHCCPSTTISLASTFRAFHTHPLSPSLASGTSLNFHDHRSSTAHSDTPFSYVQAFSLAGGQPASVSFPRRRPTLPNTCHHPSRCIYPVTISSIVIFLPFRPRLPSLPASRASTKSRQHQDIPPFGPVEKPRKLRTTPRFPARQRGTPCFLKRFKRVFFLSFKAINLKKRGFLGRVKNGNSKTFHGDKGTKKKIGKKKPVDCLARTPCF